MSRATLHSNPSHQSRTASPGDELGAHASLPSRDRFITFAWILLIYNLAAVAWGVYVRASVSGDGCGSHWPLCDGRVIPAFGTAKQVIEFSHRVSTGLILPMVLGLVVGARRLFPRGHQARAFAYMALAMTVIEALIGMALVKLGLVATNDSAARAGVMSFHVVSTFLLVSSIALAALSATEDAQMRLRRQAPIALMLAIGVAGMLVLGISGAISALGHTLRPVENVLAEAAKPGAFWMVRLQPMHPYLALATGLYLLLLGGMLVHLRPDRRVRSACLWMIGAYTLQLALGLLNIWLKAPIWMQMAHLVLADVCFIALVVAGFYALVDGSRRREELVEEAHPEPMTRRELVGAYVALTKPRVISLLLFTTLAAAFAAARGWPGAWLLAAVALGGYMAAGAANAINMVIDRDIDGHMKRTATRPTVTQAIPFNHALMFGLALAIGSFSLLWAAANLLTATLALAGLVIYVNVYTLLLKRRTWHNIVIGGASGAVPPLVGWAAVAGELSPFAWWMFALIFLWTPVHFWALALLLKDDYAKAGVPMLPVVRGERMTVIQISFYTVLTVALSILPFVQGQAGPLFLVATALLDVALIVFCMRLFKKVDRPRASALFHYSMLYLAILFLAVAIDQAALKSPRSSVKSGGVVSLPAAEGRFVGAAGKLMPEATFLQSSRREGVDAAAV